MSTASAKPTIDPSIVHDPTLAQIVHLCDRIAADSEAVEYGDLLRVVEGLAGNASPADWDAIRRKLSDKLAGKSTLGLAEILGIPPRAA